MKTSYSCNEDRHINKDFITKTKVSNPRTSKTKGN